MKHLVFPTVAQADAFIADLRAQGLIQPEVGQTSFSRRDSGQNTASAPQVATQEKTVTTQVVEGGGTTGDMAGGALAGGALGTAAGLAAGAVVAATGGLAAIPVILGLGVGAAAGAATAAVEGHGHEAVIDSHTQRYQKSYELDNDYYDRLNTAVGTEGRAVAVEDTVPADAVEAAAVRHGGRFV